MTTVIPSSQLSDLTRSELEVWAAAGAPDQCALRRLYVETCNEYNASSLATDDGYYHKPNDFTLLQLKEVVQRLPATEGLFLDIGTGSGIVPRVIRRLGTRAVTVDWPVTGTEKAILSAREAGVEGHYCQVGKEPLPLPNDSVDCLLFADVIEHLLHSPKPVLAEILRVLKPGGACVATTPNALRLTVRVKVPLGYSNWPLVLDYWDAEFHGGHHHEYTIDEFREVFRRAGFMEENFLLHEARLGSVRVSGFDQIRTLSRRTTPTSQRMSLVLRIASGILGAVARVLPHLRSEMVIVARKPEH